MKHVAAFVALVALSGCDKKPEATPPAPTPPKPVVVDVVIPSLPDVRAIALPDVVIPAMPDVVIPSVDVMIPAVDVTMPALADAASASADASDESEDAETEHAEDAEVASAEHDAAAEGHREAPHPAVRPPAGGGASAAEIADSKRIFDRVCGRCHPNGNAGDGPGLRGKNWAEARTRGIIRSGKEDMPPIRPTRLSDADLTKMMVFLRSIRAVR